MNVVLADTEEFRRVKRKQAKPAAPGASGPSSQTIETEEKRTLGLTIVRGAHIVSLSVESPPPVDPSTRLGKSAPGGITSTLAAGPGVARPAGRGAAAPPSLAVCLPLLSHSCDFLTNIYQGPAAGVGLGAPPGFGGFPPPGFPGGRGGMFPSAPSRSSHTHSMAAPPPGFPGAFPPAGFPPNAPFPPPGFNPGGPPAPGFNPPPRR
jgi:small nuclear ribonucleoprotein B and B'